MSDWNENLEEYREKTKKDANIALTDKWDAGKFSDETIRIAGGFSENSESTMKLEDIPTQKLEAVEKLMEASAGHNIFIYDKREERSGRPQQVVAALKAWGKDMKVVPVVLPIGDYIVNGACIEFKTDEDFIQSKISGHLDMQLFNMSARYPNSYLIVEGDVDMQAAGRVHRNAILSSKIGASFKRSSHGVHGMVNFIEIESGEFPLVVKFILSKEHIRYPPPLKVPINRSEMAVATLSTIPGVREVRARDLLNHFGSLRAVFNATREEVMEISGIGPTIADDLTKYVTQKIERKEKHIL